MVKCSEVEEERVRLLESPDLDPPPATSHPPRSHTQHSQQPPRLKPYRWAEPNDPPHQNLQPQQQQPTAKDRLLTNQLHSEQEEEQEEEDEDGFGFVSFESDRLDWRSKYRSVRMSEEEEDLVDRQNKEPNNKDEELEEGDLDEGEEEEVYSLQEEEGEQSMQTSQEKSLQVVRDILTEMENMDMAEEVLKLPNRDSRSNKELGSAPCRLAPPPNSTHRPDPTPPSCTGCRLPGSTDLVVDVHLESTEDIPRPCVKHSFDRFPRCYSESRGNLSREEFRNIDKIETIGEDRLRHMSEGAGRGRGGRAAARGQSRTVDAVAVGSGTFCCSGKGRQQLQQLQQQQQQQCCSPERKYEISEYDSSPTVSNLGSLHRLDLVDSSCAAAEAAARLTEVDPNSTPATASAAVRPTAVKFQIFDEPTSSSLIGGGADSGGGLGSGTLNTLDSPDSSLDQSQMEFNALPFKDGILGGGMVGGYKTTMSSSSSTTSMPICRICQLPSMEPSNHLISPCRCLGSIRYVHNPCLLKWLEVCSRKNSDAPCCELCQFQYLRKKRFLLSQCLFPSCSTRDKVLHAIFLLSIALMVTCAGVTILCFKQDRDSKPKTVGPNTELSPSELMTLSCGVLFFLAFFVAMYVEVKAKNTVYQLICKFLYMNYDWTIQEYDRKKDPAKQIEDS